jgi:hypothetical protein
MSDSAKPWWKFGHVWMVIAGPAIVVVAGFVTLYLAISTPDPVIRDESRTAGSLDPKTYAANAPAGQARNHAQTGVPLPAEKKP